MMVLANPDRRYCAQRDVGEMRNETELSDAMRNVSAATVRERLADAGITSKTKASYESSLRRLDGVAKRAGVSNGMREKEAFMRFLGAMLATGKGGTSTANSYRSALAWRQRREGVTVWAADEDVVDAVKSVGYAAREQGRVRGAISQEMILEAFDHTVESNETLAFMMAVQWSCGLRIGELLSLKTDCLSDGQLLLQKDKRMRRGNKTITQQLHWKPIEAKAQTLVRHAKDLAAEQGRGNKDDLLFSVPAPKYRAWFKEVVRELGWEESMDLDFVPHSHRHGFVCQSSMELLPPDIQERLGMSAGTVRRYSEGNESRRKRSTAARQTPDKAAGKKGGKANPRGRQK